MDTKRIGYGALRLFVWLLLAWVLVRGVVSFLPDSASGTAPANALSTPGTASTSHQAVATLFAYEFLTWRPNDPVEHAQRIAPYLDPQLDPQAGWTSPTGLDTQRATNAWVASAKQLSASRWLVTVVTLVSSAPDAAPKAVYLAVPVGQTTEGGWVVYDYPTLLPPPTAGNFTEPLHYGAEVADQDDQIRTLLTKFFPAYFAANQADLAYLLDPGAGIQAFQSPWTYDSIANLILSQTDDGLYALTEVLLVDPATGARFTSRYTIALADREGRWYISQILQEGE